MNTENSEKIEIKKATEVSEQALKDFYTAMYPDRAEFLAQHWRWLYRVGVYPSMQGPWVAMKGNQVIGHAGQIPVTLQANGAAHDAIWFPDLGILPDYQGLGLGKRLTKAWMDACPLHMAFPNDQAERLFTKLGWSFRKDAVSFRWILTPEAHPRFSKRPFLKMFFGIVGITNRSFCQGLVLFSKNVSEAVPNPENLQPFSSQKIEGLHVLRSPEFLKWRVLQNPNAKEFRILNFTAGREKYSAIVRVFERQGYRRLHILSLCGKGEKGITQFLKAILKWALKRKIHHIWMISSDSKVITAAKTLSPLHNLCLQAFHAEDQEKLNFLNNPQRLWECIDFEFDLLYC